MSSDNETMADIIAEVRRNAESAQMGHKSFLAPSAEYWIGLAARLEAAWKRENEAWKALHEGSVQMLEQTRAEADSRVEEVVKHGNAAAIREAMEMLNQLLDSCVLGTHSEMTADEMDKVDELYFKTKAALAAPPRNCDRPECQSQTDAQNVWMHEDRGETAYYEWLFAAAEKGAEDGKVS